MIIYWSMIGWVVLISLVYSIIHKKTTNLVEVDDNENLFEKVSVVYAFITFSYLIFWIGEREYVMDTSEYIYYFDVIPTDFSEAWSQIDWEGKGPLFSIYKVLFKCYVSDDYTMWLFSITIFCSFCIVHTVRKYSMDFFYSCFMFMTLGIFVWMMNGMRQFIAVSLVFLCSDFIIKGKFLKFLIIVLIASQIHTTALLMIPIYFVVRGKPWSYRTSLASFAIILICIFAEPFFNSVDSLMTGTSYEGESLILEGDDGVHPLRVLLYSVPPIIAFVKKNQLSNLYDKYPIISISINMSLVSAFLYLMGMFTSGILAGRLPIYAELYNLILLPLMFKVCFKENSRKILYGVSIGVLILYFYLLFGNLYYHSELTGTIL